MISFPTLERSSLTKPSPNGVSKFLDFFGGYNLSKYSTESCRLQWCISHGTLVEIMGPEVTNLNPSTKSVDHWCHVAGRWCHQSAPHDGVFQLMFCQCLIYGPNSCRTQRLTQAQSSLCSFESWYFVNICMYVKYIYIIYKYACIYELIVSQYRENMYVLLYYVNHVRYHLWSAWIIIIYRPKIENL